MADRDPPATLSDDLAAKFGLRSETDDTWLTLLASAHVAPPPTPQRIGQYDVLGIAGRGGQGVVYRVRQPGTGRAIALKKLGLGPFASTRDRLRFERELQAVARLSHPAIVTLLGHDTVAGEPAILMEWIEGQPLDLWARRKHASLADTLDVFAMVCDAVAHAHRRGVLHRDLKPANVLIVQCDDGRPCPKILDFGLSQLAGADQRLTLATEGFMGTPAYCAPEQVSGRWLEVDTRSDVYALGVMLYQCLTGTLPFDAHDNDLPALLSAICHHQPVRPSRRAAQLSPHLRPDAEHDAIVLRALAKSPAHRYQSADEFAEDIRRKLRGQAVLAHPPRLLYQARAFARTHRAAVTLGTALVVGVGALASVSTVLALRLARSSDKLMASSLAEQLATQDAQDRAAQATASAHALHDTLARLVESSRSPGVLATSEVFEETQARLLAGDFDKDPALAISLWTTLAKIRFMAGDNRGMRSTLDRAASYLPGLDPASPEVAVYHITLGLYHEQLRDHRRAFDLYDQAWCSLERSQGPLAHQTLRAMSNRVIMLRYMGMFRESAEANFELIERREHSPHSTKAELAGAWAILARTYRSMRELDNARFAISVARTILDASPDPSTRTHDAMLRTLREEAFLAEQAGDLLAAESAHIQLLEIDRIPRSDGSGRGMRFTHEYADFLKRQERFGASLDLYLEAHEVALAYATRDNPERGEICIGLMNAARLAGRDDLIKQLEPKARDCIAALRAAGAARPARTLELRLHDILEGREPGDHYRPE